MSWLWWLFGVPLALFWLRSVIDAALGMRTLTDITDPEWEVTPVVAKRISIVVPARNEQEHLERALTALLELDYPNYEVIAVDDRSSDATGAIMDRLATEHKNRDRLRIIHISELPNGWLGKPHAMWSAAAKASGEWLLFTDADIHFRADVLRRACNYAESRAVDHLVLFPTHTDWTFSKKVMLSGFNILFMFGHRPWKTADPNSRDHIGVGAFNMIRREVYEKIGTFQALRMEIIEDMRLGKLVKDAGYKQHNVLGPDLLLLDWGDHALDIIHNLTKNFFSLLHFSVPRTIGALLLLLGINLLPFVGAVLAHGWAKVPYMLALLSVLCMYVGMSWYSPISPLFVLLHPVATLLLAYTLLKSMSHALLNDGIVWRGTHYSLRDLRSGLVKG
ncbi:MAG TPA: glycosyltransferase [Terriglobales bacterium]|nr:glycosyltransferase [Terriglobales bacterium]